MQQQSSVPTFSDYLSVGEAANFVGVSPWTLRNWDNAGKLKPVRHPVSGHRLYRRETLEEFLRAGLSERALVGSPEFDWSRVGEDEHFVQFYEDARFLMNSLCSYLAEGLSRGEGAIVIATRPHRNGLHRRLKRLGLDVKELRRSGQYVALDAAETLADLCDGETPPDAARFREILGVEIARLSEGWSRVRAFGEMVALLWAEGRVDAAFQLEDLWNEILPQHRCALFCAYPLSIFESGTDPAELNRICSCHSRVIPAESFSTLSPRDEQLRTIAVLQQKARCLEEEVAQRRKVEQELSEFLENAVEGIHKVGPDGRILWANRAELEMLGYDENEYVGRHISEFYVDQNLIADMLERVCRGEVLYNQQAQLRRKDGTIKQVLVHSKAVYRNGEFLYSSCFTRDVTEIKAAARDRAMLAAIVGSSDDAIVSKTFDGTIRSWNASAERLFGYSTEEAVGRRITLVVPEDRLGEEEAILTRLSRGERIDHYETVRKTKDGRLIDISLTISPLRDESGQLIGASTIARDITERKRSEMALRESEHRFARFMRALPGPAWIKDAQGRYVYVNEAAEETFRRSREEICGRTDTELFAPETAAAFRENDQRALESECGIQVVERLQLADGLHYSLASKFPIPDAQGQIAYVGGVAVDITERMQTEQALKEADRRKDEFLATLSHELRNPLAPIRNSLHVLRLAGGAVPQVESAREMIERQVLHMVRLVDDLLELSRISRGTIELKKETIDLESAIGHAVETSRPLIDSSGLSLEVQLPAHHVKVEADPVRLSQVFANLLNNAAKYTDRGGSIRVRADCDGDEVIVTVRDTGIGIPQEMLGRVFDMFSQVDGAVRRSQDGLGIGLSLVRSLVEMHGGTVEARSAGLQQGSEFVVRLPRAKVDGPARQHGRPMHASGGADAAQRILVVDDNRDSADSLAMLLRALGAEVLVAYDGATALEVARDERPEVVLMDLGMPGMSGFEAARRIRQDPFQGGVSLIAMTGWGQEEDRRKSREAGFDHHLVKPVDLNELQELLSEMAAGRGRSER